jgi:cytochrome c553
MFRDLKTVTLLGALIASVVLAGCDGAEKADRIAEARVQRVINAEAAEAARKADLYTSKGCNTCHGDDGIHALLPTYPVLARQSEKYIIKQVQDIKSGERTSGLVSVMKPFVMDLTDDEIASLASYIADGLGDGAPIGTGTPDEESVGAKLFKTKTCTACHGKDAVSPILASYPKIAGHTKEYAQQQMLDIKHGVRANGMAVMGMKGVMHLVTEEEIGHLAEYIASLPR